MWVPWRHATPVQRIHICGHALPEARGSSDNIVLHAIQGKCAHDWGCLWRWLPRVPAIVATAAKRLIQISTSDRSPISHLLLDQSLQFGAREPTEERRHVACVMLIMWNCRRRAGAGRASSCRGPRWNTAAGGSPSALRSGLSWAARVATS